MSVPCGTLLTFASTSPHHSLTNSRCLPIGTTRMKVRKRAKCSTWNTRRIAKKSGIAFPDAFAYSDPQHTENKIMGRVIAVANQKCGVGKTTTAINLAASLAAAEVNTLLVDCDPQSNSTSGLGLAKDPERISIYDVIIGAASAEEALQLTKLEQLWQIGRA